MMNKKLQFMILFLLLLFSCGQENSKEQYHSMTTTNISVEGSLVIGRWTLNNVISENLSTKCNACPTLSLNKNDLAVLRYPNNEEYEFKWKLVSNKILFQFSDDKSKQNFFSDEFEFNYKLIDKNDRLSLELSSLKNNKKYILSRMK